MRLKIIQPTQKPKPHRIGLLLILFNMPILLGGTDSLILAFLYPTLVRLLVDVTERIFSDGRMMQNVKTFKHVPTTSKIAGFHLPRCNLSYVTNFYAEYRRNIHIHYTSYTHNLKKHYN